MKKAYEESLKGAVVVCLVPVASDTGWWHTYVMKADEIRFVKGRVKFIGYDEQGNPIRNSPTFSSCVVIFRDMYKKRFTPYIGKIIEHPWKVPK
jgi:site-specific DNA-methyltransferase (adenine-specific)